MLIRCDKCSTLYELDENLLPPRGAPVQCSKCQFVFTAYPAPRTETSPASLEGEMRGGGAEASEAAQTSGAASAASGPTANPSLLRAAQAPGSAPIPFPAHEEGETAPAASAPAANEPQFTADGRPIRKVPFPKVEDPAPAGQQRPAIGRAAGRAGALTRFPRRSALLWIVPLAVVVVLAIAFAAWRMLGHRVDPAATPRRDDHQSRLLGDRATLAARVASLDDLAHRGPEGPRAEA